MGKSKYAWMSVLVFLVLGLVALIMSYGPWREGTVGEKRRGDLPPIENVSSLKAYPETMAGNLVGIERTVERGKARRLLLEEIFATLHVVDGETGRPVEGAGIFKSRRGLIPSLKWSTRLGLTDKGGVFRVQKGAFTPRKSVLLVAKEGYPTRVFSVESRKKELVVKLRKGNSLEVKLIKPDWSPVKGVPVVCTSFPLGRGRFLLRLMEGRPLPGPSLEGALVAVKKSDWEGRCLFSGLDPEKPYQVSALSRTMVEVDKRPSIPKGNSGLVTITLGQLYGFWAKIKGDDVENWSLDLGPSLKKKFVRPLFYNISFFTGKNESELAGNILGFMVPARGAYKDLPASPHVADIPTTVWLGERGPVTVSVAIRKVTSGFAPQVIDVSKFPKDPEMGKVHVVLQNPDGGELPCTPGVLYLMVRSAGGGSLARGRYHGIGKRLVWKVPGRIHYLPAGTYEVQFCNGTGGRMFECFLQNKARTFGVRPGIVNKWGLRMKKTLVPLKFRFFSSTGHSISYGYLSMYPSSPENLSKVRLVRGFRYYAQDFIETGYSARYGKKKIEDVVLFAPDGEEMIVRFKPNKVYGLGEFEERMVFHRKQGIQVVERSLSGSR